MSVEYTWLVEQMEAYPQKDGFNDVVFTVHWRVNGADGQYVSTVYGSQGVTLDPDATFTPYADLTKEQVIDWVKDAMGQGQVAAIEDNLAGMIANQINPPVVTPPLPWVA
jgi:hypothetical protein